MIDQTWYYMDGAGAQQGPITIPQLQSLVASGSITTGTQVWTEALGEQWIPAANVEGLFPATPSAPAIVAAPTLRTPSLVTTISDTSDLQQPTRAATTPMIASTPTTQAVTGVPVPSSLAAQQGQAASPYESPVADPQQLADGLYPATITKGGSMGFWSMLFFGGILCMILGAMVAGTFTQDLEASATGSTLTIGLSLLGLGAASISISGILTYIYLYRAWKCLQPGGATVSPGAAIGFLFIPLFNIYWLFKAVGGLPKQWNTITSSYPNTKNAPKLTMAAFICMLLIPVIGQIIWLSQITKGLNFMAALHFQQSRPAGSALAGLGSNSNFQ
ncbi:MAG: hypothetical protein ACI9E1_001158 [Cryomorphaceae bacterium]|jgi:hypothetical protein